MRLGRPQAWHCASCLGVSLTTMTTHTQTKSKYSKEREKIET